jgi:hypothetical protein
MILILQKILRSDYTNSKQKLSYVRNGLVSKIEDIKVEGKIIFSQKFRKSLGLFSYLSKFYQNNPSCLKTFKFSLKSFRTLNDHPAYTCTNKYIIYTC